MKHKKELSLLLVVGVLLSGLITIASAEAGSDQDPFILLGWFTNTFLPPAEDSAQDRVDDQLDALENELLNAGVSGEERRVKRGDVILLESGSSITPLAGEFSASATGTILDVTEGVALEDEGSEIRTNHRYLAAENTKAAFSVNTDTAVLRLTGSYQFLPSQETDYNALADCLKAMGLFRGSDTPYGSGYDLEMAPTRIQGLIMFIRLLGEEQDALAFDDESMTFSDVGKWARPYVAYAYSKGYTKGQQQVSETEVLFGPQDAMAPRDYMTFLLRALGYQEGESFKWKTAVDDALSLGVLTKGEASLLQDKAFLRAQVVYLSYYALSARTAGEGETLLDRLVAGGTVEAETAQKAISAVEIQRL